MLISKMPLLRCAKICILLLSVICQSLVATNAVGSADSPTVTTKINEEITGRWNDQSVDPAERCNDRTFVRRVFLDLAGRVPTVDEMNSFLSDSRVGKRERLIDELLSGEDHVQHYADLFDVLLMGRVDESKYNQRVKHGWRDYLERVFRENRPWNKVAGEILLARPDCDQSRGAVWFLYERNNEHQAIAEAIAPAFFGIRIECAQCHDHMMVDEILQEHYWGLVAFFNRGKNQKTSDGLGIAESAIGGFSEFANLSGESSPNVLTFLGAPTVDEVRPSKDEKQSDDDDLYVDANGDADPRVPKFSRREQFVQNVLQDHPLVAKAMVNRVWALLMGRGIVHPYDELDSMHPPSHPELLEWLSLDFAKNGFDIRRLVKSIVMSEAYQLESVRPSAAIGPDSFAWYLERPLTAEQLARSIQLTLRGQFNNDASVVKQFRQQFLGVLPDQIEVPIADSLFFSNSEGVNKFIRESDSDGHLIQTLMIKHQEGEAVSYLSEAVFGRTFDVEEANAIEEFLADRQADDKEAWAQVVWALLGSAEFRFNH